MAALLLIGGGFAGCDDGSNGTRTEDPQEEPQEKEPEEGVEVPFTVYSIIGSNTDPTALNWINLDDVGGYLGAKENNLHIIDSDEGLKKYLSADYPPVDFSTKTLLLAYGNEPYRNTPVETKIQKISDQNYVMTVNLQLSYSPAELDWRVAIVVDKLDKDSKVSLNVTKK